MNKKKESKVVPNVRFKGFTDDWKQRKLGECFTERVESMPDGELISVTINDGIRKFSELGRHDNSNDDKSKYKKVCVGDIAYNAMRMWQGASGYSPYEGIVSPAYTVLSPNSGVNSKCLAYQFKLPGMIHTFQINSQGITSDNWNLKYPALSKIEIFVSTDEEEQAKIAEYFENFDRLITFHQQKITLLTKLKKAMLEKMFPKKGSVIPEFRFNGFANAWEQCKLGELAEIVGGGTPSTSVESYWDGDIDWYAPAEIGEQIYLKSSQRKITEEGLNKSSAKVLPVGTVLFTSRAGIGKTAILLKEGCTNQGFQSIVPNKNKLDSYFIFTRSEELKRYGETVGAGSTFVEVSGKQMANMELMMPTTMDEQQKIGEYFSNLDNLITLHQRKIDKIKNLKKAMLDQMFIY